MPPERRDEWLKLTPATVVEEEAKRRRVCEGKPREKRQHDTLLVMTITTKKGEGFTPEKN